jgi:hypothetical protein
MADSTTKNLENSRRFQLDVSKFQLDVFKAQVDAEVDLLRARADYLLKMQDVIAKEIKNEQELTRLAWMRLQLHEFSQELADTKQRFIRALARERKIEVAVKRIALFAWGETIDPQLVGIAWSGFFTLLGSLSFESRMRVAGLTVSEEERAASSFSHPRTATELLQTAPESVTNALALWSWARALSYIPRSGGKAQRKLIETLETIAESGSLILEKLRHETQIARERLEEKQRVLWKETPPKATTPAPSSRSGTRIKSNSAKPSTNDLDPSSSSRRKSTTKKGAEKDQSGAASTT